MGFFDKLKGKVSGAVQGVVHSQATPPPAAAQPPPQAPVAATEPPEDEEHEESEPFDTAGFGGVTDEDAYFTAARQMDSDGEGGGTDASRAEIMQRYGIRDRSHWRIVKESCEQTLVKKYGSYEEMIQVYMKWQMGDMQKQQMAKVAELRKGGGFEPVENITLERWASLNAALASGASFQDLLKGAGIDQPRWERASAAWLDRMTKDTTFAITTVYGNAFQAASQGKYAANVKDAIAARTENRDLALPLPVSYEQFFDIMYEQSYAFAAGEEPQSTLKKMGLSVVDWTDLGNVMGYHMNRYGMRDHAQITAASNASEAKAKAKWPQVTKADVDIEF